MRGVLLILILVVVGVIAAVATGFLDINQTRSAEAPDIRASREGVAAQGGQAPKFDVDTGQVAIGTTERAVKLPSIEVRPAETRRPAPGAAPQPQPRQQPAPPSAQGGNVPTTDATQQ
ncbi:hypothetical protein ACFQPG_01710 [Sphingomonas sp. GCM10030256]|uniref:hypothetical protein n=1 Tax=Sphingomonas sp. GCM10030256 TaxID=3273427 RepID=UPI003614B60D